MTWKDTPQNVFSCVIVMTLLPSFPDISFASDVKSLSIQEGFRAIKRKSRSGWHQESIELLLIPWQHLANASSWEMPGEKEHHEEFFLSLGLYEMNKKTHAFFLSITLSFKTSHERKTNSRSLFRSWSFFPYFWWEMREKQQEKEIQPGVKNTGSC